MGGALSSIATNPRDTPYVDSSSNSAISGDSQEAKSSPSSEKPSMSDSDSKTLDPKSETPETESLEHSASANASDPSIGGTVTALDGEKPQEDRGQSEKDVSESAEEGEEEEEEGECGFCLFMKAGGCKDSFIAWEQCIEEAEKLKEDIVEKCSDVTAALKKCMEAHADYYEPILRAEKVAEEEAIKELEMEKEREKEKEASSESTHQYVFSVSEDSEHEGASN